MVTERLEIRLDPTFRRWMTEMADERGDTLSNVVRDLLERGREEVMREIRHRAIEELCAMEIEDMPDPEELNRQLASKYDTDLP